MGRLALELEKILAACREKGVGEPVLTAILAIYKKAYREGYHDGKTDCEESQGEKEERDDLY